MPVNAEHSINQANIPPQDLVELRRIIAEKFSKGELSTILFDLGIDDEQLSEKSKDPFIMEVIKYCQRRNQLDVLAHKILIARFETGDDGFIETIVRLWIKWGGRIQAYIKVAIFLADDLYDTLREEIDEIEFKIADFLGLDLYKVKILRLAAGSTHLLISLPKENAETLMQGHIDWLHDHYSVKSIESFDDLDDISKNAWYLAPNHQDFLDDLVQDTPVYWETLLSESEEMIAESQRLKPSDLEIAEIVEVVEQPIKKCRLGSHTWEQDEDNPCKKFCNKCGDVREKHAYGKFLGLGGWVPHPNPEKKCWKCRECNRCETIQFGYGQVHSWGTWFYDKKNSCRETRICSHCGEIEINENKTGHNFDKWDYIQEDECTQLGICSECGREMLVPNSHPPNYYYEEFVSPQTRVNCDYVRICRKCGKVLFKGAKHDLGDPYLVVKSCRLIQRCRRCGGVFEAGSLEHDWGRQWIADIGSNKWKKMCQRCGMEKFGDSLS